MLILEQQLFKFIFNDATIAKFTKVSFSFIDNYNPIGIHGASEM